MKTVLKILQWQDRQRAGSGYRPKRWVLKCPQHLDAPLSVCSGVRSPSHEPAENAKNMEQLLQLYSAGKLKPIVNANAGVKR